MDVSEKTLRTDRAALDELLVRAAAGSREALAGLYSATRGAVYAMALSVLKNAEDARDVTQDTYVQVLTAGGQYRSQGSPMAWLLTVTRNLAGMRLRKQSRQTGLTDEEWDAIPDGSGLFAAEDRALIQEALARLRDDERQIVLLHATSGLKHREIAALLGMPTATVLSKYHRALKKLRAQLEGDDVR